MSNLNTEYEETFLISITWKKTFLQVGRPQASDWCKVFCDLCVVYVEKYTFSGRDTEKATEMIDWLEEKTQLWKLNTGNIMILFPIDF